jgi:hypothetical protein
VIGEETTPRSLTQHLEHDTTGNDAIRSHDHHHHVGKA